MRANLKLCLLPSKWEHVVPTDMHRGHRLRWGNSGSSASRVGAPELAFRPLLVVTGMVGMMVSHTYAGPPRGSAEEEEEEG